MNRSDRWAAAAGIFAAPFYLALIIVLGAVEPGFSHLTSLMSLLGGVPGLRGTVFNLGVAATGVMLIAFAIGLQRQLPAARSTEVGFGLLVIGGLGLLGAASFPCDEGCTNILLEPDVVGRVHIAASFVAGMGTAVAPFFFWVAMRSNGTWKSFAAPTLMAGVFANLPGITLWVTLVTGDRLQSIEGLLQRVGFVIVLIWVAFAAARMLRPARGDGASRSLTPKRH